MTKQIPLTKGLFALVDDEDFEYLMQWQWFAIKGRKTFYASRHVGVFPFRKSVSMHSVIANTPKGMRTDHKDLNGLNNTRKNLRICTNTQNLQNTQKHSNNTSGYKGVYWCKRDSKWVAMIRVNGKRKNLGRFASLEDAALAYNDAAKQYHGEYAYLNNLEM